VTESRRGTLVIHLRQMRLGAFKVREERLVLVDCLVTLAGLLVDLRKIGRTKGVKRVAGGGRVRTLLSSLKLSAELDVSAGHLQLALPYLVPNFLNDHRVFASRDFYR